MAALTWRNVDAPNFSGANQAANNAQSLLSNAVRGLQDGLGGFQQQQAQQADSQVLMNALKVTDPAEFQRKLQSGEFTAGLDPNTVSPQTLRTLGNLSGDLLNQAATRQRIDQSQYTDDRTRRTNTEADNARGASAGLLGITDPRLAALPVNEQQALAQGRATLTGTNLSNENRAFTNKVQVREDADSQTAAGTTSDILRSSLSTSDARRGLEDAELTPGARSRVEAGVGRAFPGLYAPIGSDGGAPVGGGKPGTRQGNAYDTTFNFTPTDQPITQTPIGDVVSLQEGFKQTQGGSPMGAFQITQSTLKDYAPKVLGDDWESKPLSAENQEKIAKQIFEDRKGRDLSATWAALPNSSPGAYKDFSWAEMRQILANGEVGQNLPNDPGTLGELSRGANQQIQSRVAQNNAVGLTADVDRLYADVSTPGQAADKLIKEGGLTGADPTVLIEQIRKIKGNNPGITDAQAAAAIARNVGSNSFLRPDGFESLSGNWLGGGLGYDVAGVDNSLKDLRRGTTEEASRVTSETRREAAGLDSAQKNYDQALSTYREAVSRQNDLPNVSTDRQEAALERATQALQRAIQRQQSDPNLRPVR